MRKLCRAVFSRYFISAITILAELVLLLFLVLYAYNYSLPIYLFMVLFAGAVWPLTFKYFASFGNNK